MNKYERIFMDHTSREALTGPNFAGMTKEVFEAKFGGAIYLE